MSIDTPGQRQQKSASPAVWLAGDPEDLAPWMKRGAAGIVTNTIVLEEMTRKYGHIDKVIQRYLNLSDKKVAIEIDGHSTQELLDVGRHFTDMAPDRVILKIPCTEYALDAFSKLKEWGVETFCTTVFTLNQAVCAAQAGATHVLPFCEPNRDVGADPTRLIRECRMVFDSWANRPYITAALVRSPITAYEAIRDGADGIIVFWPVFRDMLQSPLTDQWNKTFLEKWDAIYDAGNLKDVPYTKA